MPRYAYVDGRYVPHDRATTHIEDRGYQFADGVYEVMPIQYGRILDERQHLDRLDRSLSELSIAWPMARRALSQVMRKLVEYNRVTEGIIYLQVTRGVAPRDFKFPKGAQPTLVMTTTRKSLAAPKAMRDGVSVVTTRDLRWKRRDIKSVALLPAVLAKQTAVEAGAFEAWQVDDDGYVTEGSSSNAWIVSQDGTIVTRPSGPDILTGCTRQSLIRLAERHGIPVAERAFTVDEAYAAREAFLSSASTYLLPITSIDGQAVGTGKPGPVVTRLRESYEGFAASDL